MADDEAPNKLKDHIEAAANALEKVEQWRQTALAELEAAEQYAD